MEFLIVLIAALALLISLGAFAVSYWNYDREWRKPFSLSCTLRGEVWYPPIWHGSPFSLILPVVLRNGGARPGVVQASFVRLIEHAQPQVYRLEAVAIVDVQLAMQVVQAQGPSQVRALSGIGGFVQLGKYEAREVGIHFDFPPEDAARYKRFADPKTFQPGNYRLEVWCCVDGQWACYTEDPHVTVRAEQLAGVQAGQASLNISGHIYDTAPGAPLAVNEP